MASHKPNISIRFFLEDGQRTKLWEGAGIHLEEALQPPHLEDPFSYQDAQLEDRPPLDPRVGALGRVPVRAFPHHNVRLFVLDLGQEFGELSDCKLKLASL
jgi:hypothetical protein